MDWYADKMPPKTRALKVQPRRQKRRKGSHPKSSDVFYNWDTAELLALARQALKYEWSLEHESSPPLETTNDYLGFQAAVESVSWKLGLAQYHEFEAVSAIPRVVGNGRDPATAAGVLMLRSMSGDRKGEPFNIAILMAEAHALAAAQAFHSITEILANVLYIGLGLHSNQAIPERKRNLYTVARVLRPQNQKLASALESVLNSDAFKYLSAFVNTTKHRRLLNRRFSIALHEPRKFGLRFLPFKYEFGNVVQVLPPKWLDEFLRESKRLVSRTIVLVGEAVATSFANQLKPVASNPSFCRPP